MRRELSPKKNQYDTTHTNTHPNTLNKLQRKACYFHSDSFQHGVACWLECRRTRDRKVASSNPGRSGERIFFSRVNFVCWFLFGVRSIPVIPPWHVKDPGHSAKSAGGRLHLNVHTPWPSEVAVGWLCRCLGIVWEPIRKRAHTQLARAHSVTVVSAHSATVDWSWPKTKRVELLCTI